MFYVEVYEHNEKKKNGRHLKNQVELLEMKDTISKMKIKLLVEVNSRLDTVEEK